MGESWAWKIIRTQRGDARGSNFLYRKEEKKEQRESIDMTNHKGHDNILVLMTHPAPNAVGHGLARRLVSDAAARSPASP